MLVIGMLMGLASAGSVRAQTPGPQQVQIAIAQPSAGATITGTEVLVALAIGGDIRLNPDAGDTQWNEPGLFHVFLDQVDVLQTPLLRFSLQPVVPGPHTLRVEMQDWPAGRATPAATTFTVAAAPLPPGASWWLGGTVVVLAVVLGGGLLLLWLFWVRPLQMAPVYDGPDEVSSAEEADSDPE
jgi:hypothetical protein